MKDVSLIVYPAADMAKAKQFFSKLIGADPYADAPYYVGYRNGELEIGLVPNADNRAPNALAYWTVDDIAAKVKEWKPPAARSCKKSPTSPKDCSSQA